MTVEPPPLPPPPPPRFVVEDIRSMATSELVIMLGNKDVLVEQLFGDPPPERDEETERVIADAVAKITDEIDRRIPVPPSTGAHSSLQRHDEEAHRTWMGAQPPTERVEIMESPRQDTSMHDIIAESLPSAARPDFENQEFIECYACSIQPGSPGLCRGCLANRETIGKLRHIRELAAKFVILHCNLEALAAVVGVDAATADPLNSRVIAAHVALEEAILGDQPVKGRRSRRIP